MTKASFPNARIQWREIICATLVWMALGLDSMQGADASVHGLVSSQVKPAILPTGGLSRPTPSNPTLPGITNQVHADPSAIALTNHSTGVEDSLVPSPEVLAKALNESHAATNVAAAVVPTGDPAVPAEHPEVIRQFQIQLDLARQLRRSGSAGPAIKILVSLMKADAPVELKRAGLLELALVAQDNNQLARAQQILAQYIQLYPQDPSVPEVMLRQGLLYRQMGVNGLAIAKFYAVMTTALNLKLDRLEYYQRLVLQAKLEIADTYFLQGKLEESADLFARLLKDDSNELNRAQIQFKLVRCLSSLARLPETIAGAQTFIASYPKAQEVPEVRFLLASALKQAGRNNDSLRQVLLLLQAQESTADQNPDVWTYWQKRAGNDIANQLYKDGDYLSTLEIYRHLAELDPSPAWQMPVWYQVGLVYERLHQSGRAREIYSKIIAREAELTGVYETPSLKDVIIMAKWRKDNLPWFDQALASSLAIQRSSSYTNSLNERHE
ncbi:MAG: tetratricopeptide repeat protein [Opitutaceae bacterium]|nr:tetratricopeptide repeat protein [Verrucomicrobiales bacterium]